MAEGVLASATELRQRKQHAAHHVLPSVDSNAVLTTESRQGTEKQFSMGIGSGNKESALPSSAAKGLDLLRLRRRSAAAAAVAAALLLLVRVVALHRVHVLLGDHHHVVAHAAPEVVVHENCTPGEGRRGGWGGWGRDQGGRDVRGSAQHGGLDKGGSTAAVKLMWRETKVPRGPHQSPPRARPCARGGTWSRWSGRRRTSPRAPQS